MSLTGKGTTTDMGTHVPCVAYWKGRTPSGLVSSDLIDFTDFYTTIGEAAGVKRGADDPIDGRSFLPQLIGGKGNPREWVLSHYQPYWGNFAGRQYVRNQEFKLYRDGTFYHVPEDLEEARDLKVGEGGEPGAAARRMPAGCLRLLRLLLRSKEGRMRRSVPCILDGGTCWIQMTDTPTKSGRCLVKRLFLRQGINLPGKESICQATA
ncbi:MAG: hypothetical protein O3A87_03040 [Verrucomicrobia bacterium]|nr:hypothetical protein [Verrucomicrobiota bacterium]MDA1005441.1 hypothetical protein [Verrucomicrobiota bacterium]